MFVPAPGCSNSSSSFTPGRECPKRLVHQPVVQLVFGRTHNVKDLPGSVPVGKGRNPFQALWNPDGNTFLTKDCLSLLGRMLCACKTFEGRPVCRGSIVPFQDVRRLWLTARCRAALPWRIPLAFRALLGIVRHWLALSLLRPGLVGVMRKAPPFSLSLPARCRLTPGKRPRDGALTFWHAMAFTISLVSLLSVI